MKLERLDEILAREPPASASLVIGDLMLDEFVWGKVGRISPEAPVPVVEVTGESFYPGGAANVARNLREFIDRVCGRRHGRDGSRRPAAARAPGRTKNRDRAVARGSRFPDDRENAHYRAATSRSCESIANKFARRQPEQVAQSRRRVRQDCAGHRRSHFRRLRQRVSSAPNSSGRFPQMLKRRARSSTADPNPHHPIDWRNMTAVKPNRSEAFLAAGFAVD